MRVILFRVRGDEIAGRLAGTEAGDRAVVAAQIVGDLNRVVLDGHIEVVECQDQQQVDHDVQPGGVVERPEERVPHRMCSGSICRKLPIVPGMETIAEAKMMGMTPLIFSFRGR